MDWSIILIRRQYRSAIQVIGISIWLASHNTRSNASNSATRSSSNYVILRSHHPNSYAHCVSWKDRWLFLRRTRRTMPWRWPSRCYITTMPLHGRRPLLKCNRSLLLNCKTSPTRSSPQKRSTHYYTINSTLYYTIPYYTIKKRDPNGVAFFFYLIERLLDELLTVLDNDTLVVLIYLYTEKVEGLAIE